MVLNRTLGTSSLWSTDDDDFRSNLRVFEWPRRSVVRRNSGDGDSRRISNWSKQRAMMDDYYNASVGTQKNRYMLVFQRGAGGYQLRRM